MKDFERAPHGSPLWGSLAGPDLLDAHEQYNRERMIALEETKILREKLRWCYRREGVNHLENCKDEVQAYLKRISVPEYGMEKGPSRFF